MKLLSVLLCACVLFNASVEVAANKGKGATGQNNRVGGKGGKGKTNKMASSKSSHKLSSSTSTKDGMVGKGGKAKASKKSSKKSNRMGKGGKGGKGDMSMNPSMMPSDTPVAVSEDVSNDAVSFDDSPVASPDAASLDDSPTMSQEDAASPDASPVDSGSMDDNSAALSYDDEDRAGTESPSNTATIIFATSAPTDETISEPTRAPFVRLTAAPVTSTPSVAQTKSPTIAPIESTSEPTGKPTGLPTKSPTKAPTKKPTTSSPTKAPTKKPTSSPTKAPTTSNPTVTPTLSPTSSPTKANRLGGQGDDIIPLISILQGRIEPNSYYGGAEFEDPISYQMKALFRVEEQDGVEWVSDHTLLQYYILYCIYYSANGANWKSNTGWEESTLGPCSGWFGISCDEENNIVGINLYDNGLNGLLPPEVSLLASDGFRSTGAGALQSLDLYLNADLGNGNDNYWISELGSSLRYLFLGSTSFGGTLPKLPSGLVEFDASHTEINGGLTASNFEGLDDLTWLLLDGCSFQSSIPTEFAELPSLEYFYISDAQITGDLSYMENMPVLFEHFASRNPDLTGSLPNFIGDLENLGSLNLSGNSLTGSIPTTFGNLYNMQQLWLNDNSLTGQIPTELNRLVALETLELEGNNLIGVFPESICALKDYGYLSKLGADCSVHQCECCDCCSTELCEAL